MVGWASFYTIFFSGSFFWVLFLGPSRGVGNLVLFTCMVATALLRWLLAFVGGAGKFLAIHP
jgi:hypothetical protein